MACVKYEMLVQQLVRAGETAQLIALLLGTPQSYSLTFPLLSSIVYYTSMLREEVCHAIGHQAR